MTRSHTLWLSSLSGATPAQVTALRRGPPGQATVLGSRTTGAATRAEDTAVKRWLLEEC